MSCRYIAFKENPEGYLVCSLLVTGHFSSCIQSCHKFTQLYHIMYAGDTSMHNVAVNFVSENGASIQYVTLWTCTILYNNTAVYILPLTFCWFCVDNFICDEDEFFMLVCIRDQYFLAHFHAVLYFGCI
jgi:hypothetical protein